MKNETVLKIYSLSHFHLSDELMFLDKEGQFENFKLENSKTLSDANIVIWDGIFSEKLEFYRTVIDEEMEKGKILIHVKNESNDFRNLKLGEYKTAHVATLEIGGQFIEAESLKKILNQCYQKLHNV